MASMTATDRRIAMIEYLSDYRRASYGTFMDMFGVSQSTVYRDVIALSIKYPVDCKQGNGGGIEIVDKHWHLDVRHFSAKHTAAVCKALDYARQVGDIEQASALEEILKIYSWRTIQ